MKPGKTTTEFWLISILVAVVAAIQAFQGELNAGATIAVAILAAVYAGIRAWLKHQEAGNKAAERQEEAMYAFKAGKKSKGH